MVKLCKSKGYTLIESIFVLLIVCLLMNTSIPLIKHDVSLFQLENWIRSEMVCLLQEGYLYNKSFTIEISDVIQMKHQRYGNFDGSEFSITPKLSITKPISLYAYNKHKTIEIKIWLGNGRVYVKR